MRPSRLIGLIITVFVALVLPASALASNPQQWQVNAYGGHINMATPYELSNNERARVVNYPGADIGYRHRHFKVDLDWAKNGGWEFVGQNPRDHRTADPNGKYALYNTASHQYLKYAIQGLGVDLDWSDSPVYEWQFSGSPGTLSLYDTANDSYLIYKYETWGISLGWQRKGPPPTQVGTIHNASVQMQEQPIDQGFVPYLGSYGGGGFPAVLTSVQNPSSTHWLQFVKPGYSTEQCDDPNATVVLKSNQTLTAAQMQTIWGSSTPSLHTQLPFLACVIGDPNFTSVWVNITYRVTSDMPYGRTRPGGKGQTGAGGSVSGTSTTPKAS